MSGRAALERDLVIVACAISAGIHAALAPEHPDAFATAAALLASAGVALTARTSVSLLAAAAALFAGLLGAYALSVTSGLPLVHPEPEPIDALGLFTKTVELAGLLAATDLVLRLRPKGMLA